MLVKEAIVFRFKELCATRKIKFNELAVLSGVTPSTVYSMMDSKRKDVSINTIKKEPFGVHVSKPPIERYASYVKGKA